MDTPLAEQAPPQAICSFCHTPLAVNAYFCPNCGKPAHEKPLSTSAGAQLWIYAFSLVLPMIAYLAIGYWPGVKYMRSADPKAKQIGGIAMTLLVISSVVTFWYSIVWIQQQVQSAETSVGNLNLGGF